MKMLYSVPAANLSHYTEVSYHEVLRGRHQKWYHIAAKRNTEKNKGL